MPKTLSPRDERRAGLIKAGVKLAKKTPVDKISCALLARSVTPTIVPSMVFHIFGTTAAMRKAITKAAAQ